MVKDPPAKTASLEVRRALLRALDAPEGAVHVLRRRGPPGQADVLVVRLHGSQTVPEDRRFDSYGGFDVKWEVVPPARAGRWS